MLKKIVLTGAVGVLGIGVLVVGNEILFLLKQSNTTEKIQPRSSNENNTGQFITLLILTGLGAGGVGVVAGRVFLNKRQSGAVDSPSSDLKDESVDSSTSESGESTYSKIKNQIEASSAYGKAKDAVSNLPPASEVAERIKASNAYQKVKDFVLKQPAEGQGRGQGYGRIVGIVVVGGASLAALNFLIRGSISFVQGLDPYIGKDTRGAKVYIERDDIECWEKEIPATGKVERYDLNIIKRGAGAGGNIAVEYFGTRISPVRIIRCSANAKVVDLAGKKTAVELPGTHWETMCAANVVVWKDVETGKKIYKDLYAESARDNRSDGFACLAGQKYGKFDPNWVNQ